MSQFHNGNQYNRNNYNRSADYAQYRSGRYDQQSAGNAQNYLNQNQNQNHHIHNHNQIQNQNQNQNLHTNEDVLRHRPQWNIINEQQQQQQQQPQHLYGHSERLNAYNNLQNAPAAYTQNTQQQYGGHLNSAYNNNSNYRAQCGGYNILPETVNYGADNYNNSNQFVNGYNGYQRSYNHSNNNNNNNNNNNSNIYQSSDGVHFVNNFNPANPPLPLQPPPALPPPPPPPPSPPPDSPISRAPTPGFTCAAAAAGMHELDINDMINNEVLDDDQENNNLLDANNRYNIEGNNYQPIFQHNDISMEYHLPQQQQQQQQQLQHDQQQHEQQQHERQQEHRTQFLVFDEQQHTDYTAQQELEQLLLQTEIPYISDTVEASTTQNNNNGAAAADVNQLPNDDHNDNDDDMVNKENGEQENYNSDSSGDNGDDEDDYEDEQDANDAEELGVEEEQEQEEEEEEEEDDDDDDDDEEQDNDDDVDVDDDEDEEKQQKILPNNASSGSSSDSSSNSSSNDNSSSSSSSSEEDSKVRLLSPVSSELAPVQRQWHETMAGLNLSESSDSNSDPSMRGNSRKWDNQRNQSLNLNVPRRTTSESEEDDKDDVESLKKEHASNDSYSSSNSSGKSKTRRHTRRTRVANKSPTLELSGDSTSLDDELIKENMAAKRPQGEPLWESTIYDGTYTNSPSPLSPVTTADATTPQSPEGNLWHSQTDIKLQASFNSDDSVGVDQRRLGPKSPPVDTPQSPNEITCVEQQQQQQYNESNINFTPQSPNDTPKSPDLQQGPESPPLPEGPCSPDQERLLSDESMDSFIKFKSRPSPHTQQQLQKEAEEEEDRLSDESMDSFIKLKYRPPTPPMAQLQNIVPPLVPGLVDRLVDARRSDGFDPSCSARYVFDCQRISEGAIRVEQPVQTGTTDGVTMVTNLMVAPEQYQLYVRLATEVQELQAQMKEIEDSGSKVDDASLQYFDSKVTELSSMESQFQWSCMNQQPMEEQHAMQPAMREQSFSGRGDCTFADLSLTEYAFVRYMREIEHVTCIPTKCRASEEDKVSLKDFRVVRVLGRGCKYLAG